jgi:hypothetical protein
LINQAQSTSENKDAIEKDNKQEFVFFSQVAESMLH